MTWGRNHEKGGHFLSVDCPDALEGSSYRDTRTARITRLSIVRPATLGKHRNIETSERTIATRNSDAQIDSCKPFC